MPDVNAQALRDLAEAHLAAVRKRLPTDHIGRFVLFIEVVRAMDYWGTHAPAFIGESEKVSQSFDLMYWGWNRAVAELFEPLDQPGAVPMMESTQESRVFAAGLMQEFGKVSLLRRLADMSERGIMEIAKDARGARLGSQHQSDAGHFANRRRHATHPRFLESNRRRGQGLRR